MNPRVSVIVPVYNAAHWIEETLQSVTNQTYPRDQVEIVAVDDGSTDASAAIVAEKFPAVKLIRSKNGGPSRARNLGLKAATGDFIQYLDADDLLMPDKLELQVRALEESGADVAYGYWRELTVQSDGQFIDGKQLGDPMAGDPIIELFVGYWSPPAALLFRRPIVDKIGLWNERLPIIQDARYVLDAACRGGRFVHCPHLMAKYRVHSGPSVSRRDPAAFIRDCHTNAVEVEQWFKEHGGVDEARLEALLQVYGQVARTSFSSDTVTFEAAYQALERLRPGYVPSEPRHLAVTSRLVGYRRAEALAQQFRHYKARWQEARR